ncbi:MAG: esterase family protein [Lachnospiraceae bacterium]|nr:esterase family protein [Lachnospiraceae bacterium]
MLIKKIIREDLVMYKRIISLGLCVVLTLSLGSGFMQAKKTAKPAVSKLTMTVGEKQTIKIKNKSKKAKYSFVSSKKKVAKVNKKGVVTARKKGKATITVKETMNKKAKKIGKVKVTVNDVTETVLPTNVPQTATTAPSTEPTAAPATPEPTATPTREPIVYPESHDAPSGFDAAQNGVTYGTREKVTYYSSVTGKDRKVNIILPAGYTEEKQYPVIYLFHGIGGNEDEWLSGNPDKIIGNLVHNGEAKEMIIVIPNIRAGADDSYPSDAFNIEHYKKFDNFINDLRECLMPFMEENYSIAKGRDNTAICGLSMGARESLYIGFNMLEDIGYIAALSPGYGVFAYTANGVSEPGLFTEETFTIPEEYRNNTCIMIVNGISEGGENALGGTCSRVLKQNGVNHWFYTTEGAHDFVTWKNGLYNFAKIIF